MINERYLLKMNWTQKIDIKKRLTKNNDTATARDNLDKEKKYKEKAKKNIKLLIIVKIG